MGELGRFFVSYQKNKTKLLFAKSTLPTKNTRRLVVKFMFDVQCHFEELGLVLKRALFLIAPGGQSHMVQGDCCGDTYGLKTRWTPACWRPFISSTCPSDQ